MKESLKKNKSGLSVEVIGVLVLFVTSLLILMIVFGTKIWPFLKPASEQEVCKQSVIAHSQLPVEAFRSKIVCTPGHLTVEGDLSSQQGQETAKDQLAKSLYECWGTYGQGRLNLFTTSGVYCGVCNFIDFKDKKGKITGLTDYLGKTSIPNKDISYLDFLSGYETSKFRDYMNNPQLYNSKEAGSAVEIDDTARRWATVMVYARGEAGIEKTKDFFIPDAYGGGSEIGTFTVGTMGGLAGTAIGFLVFGTGPIGWIAAALSGVTMFGISVYTIESYSDKPQWMAFTKIVPYNPNSFARLGCESLPVAREKEGRI